MSVQKKVMCQNQVRLIYLTKRKFKFKIYLKIYVTYKLFTAKMKGSFYNSGVLLMDWLEAGENREA